MKYTVEYDLKTGQPDKLVNSKGQCVALFTWLADRQTAERIELALEVYGAIKAEAGQ